MHIALVCDYSLDYLGGAQTAFCEQARALTAGGHSVTVIAPRGERASIGATHHDWIDCPVTIPIIDLPLLRNSSTARGRVAAILRRRGVDVVHLHSEFGLAAAALDAARELGIPVVHTVHTFFWRAGLPPVVDAIVAASIRRFVGWLTARPLPPARPRGSRTDVALRETTLATAMRADLVMSPSEHQRVLLAEAGVMRSVTLPNTTTVSTVARPGPLVSIDGPLRVVWIGRCAAEKRLLVFVAGCLAALDRLPGRFAIEVIGEGPQLAQARRMSAGHPGITFAGRLPSAEIPAALAGAHVAALTSFGFDNQPMTVVEALWASRPVLYVDPALREGLDTAGLLCASSNSGAIADELVRLALDPHAVIDASRRAELAFDRFSPAHFVSDIEAAYRSILPSHACARRATLEV